MARFQLDSKVEKYRFRPILTVIMDGVDEPISLEDYMIDLVIHNNYLGNVFPIVKANISLSNDQINRLKEEADNLVFKLDLERHNAEESSEVDTYSFYDSYLKDIELTAIDMDRNPSLTEKNELKDKELQGMQEDPSNSLNLAFFSTQHLNLNKGLFNRVFHNCRLKDAVLALISEKNSDKKILMEEPVNNKVYEQIVIPPFNLTNTLYYLNRVYGLYETGIELYMGFNKYYIFSKDFPTDPVTEEGEYGEVYMEFHTREDISIDSMGCYEDNENEMYVIKAPNTVEMVVQDDSVREIHGEEITISYSTQEEHSKIHDITNDFTPIKGSDKTMSDEDNPKEKAFWNNYSNEYAETNYRHKSGRKMNRLRVPLQEISLNVITCNRKYIIHFSDPEQSKLLDGVYQLVGTTFQFVNGNKELCEVKGQAILEKVPE